MSTLLLPAAVTVRRYLAIVLALLLAATVLVIASAAPARVSPVSTVLDGVEYTIDPADPAAGAVVTDKDRDAGPVVVIPDSVTIGSAVYPVTTIGDHAFPSMGLTAVTLPDSIVTIEDFAFYNNPFTSVNLPEGLTAIGSQAFAYTAIPSLDFPASLLTLGSGAFFHSQLTSVSLPDDLVAVSNQAFDHSQLTSVTLPGNLVTIGYAAFGNNQLTSVAVPAGVTTIHSSAFMNNENLTQVRFAGPAPTTITGADTDTEYSSPSLGTAAGLTVTFPARYRAQSGQEGYTAPQWHGYTAHPDSFTVSFDTGGGAVVAPVTVSHGELLELPSAPVREGYTFTGWFTSAGVDSLFDLGLPVTENLTLYAGWQRVSVPAAPIIPAWLSLLSGSLALIAPVGAGT